MRDEEKIIPNKDFFEKKNAEEKRQNGIFNSFQFFFFGCATFQKKTNLYLLSSPLIFSLSFSSLFKYPELG